MKQRIWQGVQLVAILPVAAMSLMGVFVGLMALTSMFHTGQILASLAFGALLIAPALMVLSLVIAIVMPTEKLKARDRLAGAVALGLVGGCILAVWLMYREFDDSLGPSWHALLSFSVPLALALAHIVRLARARPAAAAPPDLPPGAVE